jgi:coproporphyrinogen III oxidase
MIDEIERADGSGETFSRDGWGAFADGGEVVVAGGSGRSGGITRVLQGGNVVEKGACSLTIIRDGILTAERASAIQGRREPVEKKPVASASGGVGDDDDVADEEEQMIVVAREGDVYSAAALSVVLHTRNPHVPTFRSDVRIFLVRPAAGGGGVVGDGDGHGEVGKSSSGRSAVAWFGGGSDLTPYYLIDRDVIDFHAHLKDMCDRHSPPQKSSGDDDEHDPLSYRGMKRSCDEYFYLPARAEHRGTGGIFFDDVPASPSSACFVEDVARGWMLSWLPIVHRNRDVPYTEEQRHWQCLRRGRYLEFNLLYDRGVRFGLANANPRVEGVMVSAPPVIAYDYNHVPSPGGEEERLLGILKEPRDWV